MSDPRIIPLDDGRFSVSRETLADLEGHTEVALDTYQRHLEIEGLKDLEDNALVLANAIYAALKENPDD